MIVPLPSHQAFHGGAETAFTDRFDVVVMLTLSDWPTEPRSNRYHYATRFATLAPVLFVQPDATGPGFTCAPSGYPGIDIVHVGRDFDHDQAAAIVGALAERGFRRPLVWFYGGYYAAAAERLPAVLRIFHATEDYFGHEMRRQFPARFFDGLSRLLAATDLMVAVSDGVRDSYLRSTGYRGETLVLENGCDHAFWRVHRPLEGRETRRRTNVAFYQGGINFRLDYCLLRDLIRSMPEWEFWFCGARIPGDAQWAAIAAMPNVCDFGMLAPENIANKAFQATVGLIPFVQTPLITEVSLPLKAYEYVACGLPVVTVPIKALSRRPDLFTFAGDSLGFQAAIRRAAPTLDDPDLMRLREEAASLQSYDRRFATLLDWLAAH